MNIYDCFVLNLQQPGRSGYIPSHPSGGGREAEELFLLPDCVHIFFVTGSGRVSTFSEPSTLRIFRFKDDSTSQDSSEAKTFIQVSKFGK